MKFYINGEKFDSEVVKLLTKEQFIATETKLNGIKKEELYDKITLDAKVFNKNIKEGKYKEKTEIQLLKEKIDTQQEVIDNLLIANLTK